MLAIVWIFNPLAGVSDGVTGCIPAVATDGVAPLHRDALAISDDVGTGEGSNDAAGAEPFVCVCGAETLLLADPAPPQAASTIATRNAADRIGFPLSRMYPYAWRS